MDFQTEYQAMFSKVTASEETRKRIMTMAKEEKKGRPGSMISKALIAAVIVSLLAVTASAASEGGFLKWFSSKNQGEPLTDSQVANIAENIQQSIAATVASQPASDYRVTVRSAITDGRTAYITLGLTAPEGQALNASYFGFTEALLIPDRTEGLAIAPDGSSPDALCDFEPVEDGDGLPNTQNLVFRIRPQLTDSGVTPFDGHIQWVMRLKKLTGVWFDGRSFAESSLSKDTWEYTLNFQSMDVREVKFLEEPKAMLASKWLRDDYQTPVLVTAFNLSSLTYTLEFGPVDSSYPRNPDDPMDVLDIGDIRIVMKDGSVKTLLRCSAQQASFDVPIVLEEVDYVLLSDGTRLPAPD